MTVSEPVDEIPATTQPSVGASNEPKQRVSIVSDRVLDTRNGVDNVAYDAAPRENSRVRTLYLESIRNDK